MPTPTATPTPAATRLTHWTQHLRSLHPHSLTPDYPLPTPSTSTVEAIHTLTIPPSARHALLQLGILDGSDPVSPFTVLLAAFVVLVARLGGVEDVGVGVGTGGGDGHGGEFVLRVNVGVEMGFVEVLKRVKELELHGTANAVPMSTLIPHLTDAWKTPTPPVLYHLSLHRSARAPPAHTPIDLSIFIDLPTFTPSPSTSPSLSTSPSRELPPVTLTAHYNQLLFTSSRISATLEQLLAIVVAGAQNPEIQLCRIPLRTPAQEKVLPDPTVQLNWGRFRGAIHDVFSANAAKHPDADCVIETAEGEGSGRVFSYRHINEASNVLAHHFLSKGVRRGDVVMVYAHRGVDLVVAVMGVLKAGATFSVIDPAYPPARQIVYLQVAQPRALVVIKKAGQLSALVREYIDTELAILTEVPALAIQEGGALDGGEGVLDEQKRLGGQGTGVVVGPDSTPTLSFTSGSEGIPKGVRGRHFSLTYYFPWMAETFSLSSTDRFTMLSGIAHDPIQRDIFTPLFLGAVLLVPTADDIGTPGRLAEWMSEHSATITHLTPAMGQLLSAQATAQIPSLQHAFFVGDILTKRDCLRLQALARNVAVINMYGTTETQRAVSYFRVPPLSTHPTFSQMQKDVVPAGKGMLDVQLLVVNRHARELLCGVGEVGEIYVRAGGLAEGYLRLPEMTAAKFLKNWYVPADHWTASPDEDHQEEDREENKQPWGEFYMGPRDRLYRTGDLGRYTPDGNVECSGRADDQIKIRGFRIELGEIDTHLSQHPLVRENVTLVRRDKDEEPTLISYIVPLAADTDSDAATDLVSGLRRHRDLIANVRAYLKGRLPSYAIPTVIVPLARLPLNPNGKIDKPALPFPDTAQLAAAAVQRTGAAALTPTQAQIADIWAGLLTTTEAVGAESNFFEMGGHSILATRMVFEVRKKFVVNVSLGAVFRYPTLAALAEEVERLQGLHSNPTGATAASDSAPEDYAADAAALLGELPERFESVHAPRRDAVVLLTGATGFLGVFILRELLRRKEPAVRKVLLHVRAKDTAKALVRVRTSCEAYGVWEDAWEGRVRCVVGELGVPRLGVSEEEWRGLAEEVDVVIHNGAQVHWVYPYSQLRPANVTGTLDLLHLCALGRPKSFLFVSSTSVLDTPHYVHLSSTLPSGVPESDMLSGSATGLTTGYGMSKWVSEHLVRAAGTRGLTGCVVRPGYILGDSNSGATNTDDFLVRMVKGCVQLGQIPDIHNTVNIVPVDHVARVVVACAFSPPPGPVGEGVQLQVAHVTGRPRMRFNQFLGALAWYGYSVEKKDYMPWRLALETHVVEKSKDNALFPLLHFVLDDLPASTKAPELDDRNAAAALKADSGWVGEDCSKGMGVGVKQMGVYLAYLVAVGFLPEPEGAGERLPKVLLGERLPKVLLGERQKGSLEGVGGRGGI